MMTDELSPTRNFCSRRPDASRSDAPPAAAAGEPAPEQASSRGFGLTFLDAMHEWRQRQAAREIQYYQHLVDDARAHQGRRGNPWDIDQAKQSREKSGGMTIVIAILIVFAVLHIVGGTLIMERSARSPAETQAVMVWGD
jgi:hypothetical protein